MTEITKEAVNALSTFTEFNKGNTSVGVYGRVASMSLHGYIIAVNNGEVYFVTDAGHKTATTKERLNGIPGVHIVQRNGDWYLNGDLWDGSIKKI